MQTTQGSSVPTVKLLINGKLVESTTSQWRDVINPATQHVLARVPFATQAEVDAAIGAAAEAFKTWRKTPIGARARALAQQLYQRFSVSGHGQLDFSAIIKLYHADA